MKEIDPIAETVHTVETDHGIAMIQIDSITEIIHIAEMEHMTEIVDTEIGTTPEIISKETNHGMTMKETDPLAGRDHMIESITEMIHIAEIEHMTEINHTIEIGHIVEIDCKTITEP